jgi:hypothetical protein
MVHHLDGRRAGLAVAALILAAPAWAQQTQPLDLPFPTGESRGVCGEIRSIREMPVDKPAVLPGIRSAPPHPQQSVPVGPTIALPFGGIGDYGWRLGAAGIPGIQASAEEITYEIIVRLDGGERRSLLRTDGSRFFVGQRVALRDGSLEAR